MLSTNVITKKPTILVAVLEGANPSVVEQIGYGMEEEGIPFDFYEHSFTMASAAAHAAALDYALAVGIGIDGKEAVLHYKNLALSQYVIRLNLPLDDPFALRDFGMNAARLVKGNPLKMNHDWEVAF